MDLREECQIFRVIIFITVVQSFVINFLTFISRNVIGIDFTYPVVIFGNNEQLSMLFRNLGNISYSKIIVVPLDSSEIKGT